MTKYDFVILAILLIFSLLGFLRGFVTELFEAIGILVAVMYGKLLALKVAPLLPDSVPEYARVPITTFVLSILIIFTIKAIGGAVRKAFVKKSLKGTDHFFGGFMGAGKGMIVVFGILAALSLTPVARLFEMEEKPAPVLRWALNKSQMILSKYSGKITGGVAQQAGIKTNTAPVLSTPATLDNLSSSLSKVDRDGIVKLLKNPAIAGLNLSEDALLKMVHEIRDSQGSK